jgi:hypothetical protein
MDEAQRTLCDLLIRLDVLRTAKQSGDELHAMRYRALVLDELARLGELVGRGAVPSVQDAYEAAFRGGAGVA